MRSLLFAALVVAGWPFIRSGNAQERLWLDAKINGKLARLAFDSGAPSSALFKHSVKKFGLELTPPTNSYLFVGGTQSFCTTKECTLTLDDSDVLTCLDVVDLPQQAQQKVDFDGVVGVETVCHRIVQLDAAAGKVKFLKRVPESALNWSRLWLIRDSGIVDLDVPHFNGTSGVLSIDTGSTYGLALADSNWSKWKAAHQNLQVTLETAYSPVDDCYVFEEAWADEISIGPVTFTSVPIQQARPFDSHRLGSRYAGTVGLAGLKCLDMIINFPGGVAYWKARKISSAHFQHNRLGAVFITAVGHTNECVARVTESGPAYEAGVRNGDILLEVDSIKAIPGNGDWGQRFYLPAGTKLELSLKRNDKPFQAEATLRDILQPSFNKRNE